MAVKCGGRCIWDKHIEYTAGIKHPYKLAISLLLQT